MKHLLTVKKYNGVHGTYTPLRTEWLTDAEMLRVKDYMMRNDNVPEFYEYSLKNSITNETTVFHSPCADLLNYAAYCRTGGAKSLHTKEQAEKNIIEQ